MLLSFGISCSVVRKKFADVSEGLTTSIFGVEKKAKQIAREAGDRGSRFLRNVCNYLPGFT
jgi:hypothetical protein